jgi:hypothetical protein
MEPRRSPPDERTAQGRGPSGGRHETAPSCEVEGGAEAYPFDASLRAEQQHDLDRLRCIKDRKLAEYLYELYAVADRNSTTAKTPVPPAPVTVFAIRATAERALAGEFGAETRELAEYLLLDETGRPRMDARTLRDFAQAFAKLRKG